jgi:hypothetical protein
MSKKRKAGPESISLSTVVEAEAHDLTFTRRTRNRHGGNNTVRPIILPVSPAHPSLTHVSEAGPGATQTVDNDTSVAVLDLPGIEEEAEFCSEDKLDRTNPRVRTSSAYIHLYGCIVDLHGSRFGIGSRTWTSLARSSCGFWASLRVFARSAVSAREL